jgi:adenosine deaminase
VARVTLVAWDGSIILDEYVQQEEEVTDYRTFVSGISQHELETATYSLSDIRRQVQDIIADKILIGHGTRTILHHRISTYSAISGIPLEKCLLWSITLMVRHHENISAIQ